MKFLTIAAFALATCLVVEFATGACPNKCSGHGICGANDVCKCQPNFIYGDCSGRLCPFSRTWSTDQDTSKEPHMYAECGGRGKCDRTTGECDCDEGYTGAGCRRLKCPNNCNSHGVCKFVEDHTTVSGYNGWDREKSMVCKCDPGYEGHACQFKMCPKGDDPLTVDDGNMLQWFHATTAASSFFLTYTDPYGMEYNTGKISIATIAASTDDDTVCASIQDALRKLPAKALTGITVAASNYYPLTRPVTTSKTVTSAAQVTASNGNIDCVITFPSGVGSTGYQNLLKATVTNHGSAGHQPIITNVDPVITIGEASSSSVTSRQLTELSTCSGRGLCDTTTGLCSCFQGHRGAACEKQEALV